eukprot:7654767-Heterocapsa_arctica.AAC.1
MRKRKEGNTQTDFQLPKTIKTDKLNQVSERGTIDRFFTPSQAEYTSENIPHSLTNIEMKIPGTAGIPAQHSSSSSSIVYPSRLIPRTMDYPAAGTAE